MVPIVIQKAIWATYRQGQEIDKNPSDAYLRNAQEAIAAVHEREFGKRWFNTLGPWLYSL